MPTTWTAALSAFPPTNRRPQAPTSPADLDRAALIIQLVCRHFACSPADLESRGPRAEMFDWPRYIAILLIKQNTAMALHVIGALFNRSLPEIFDASIPPGIPPAAHLSKLNVIAAAYLRAASAL